MREIKQGSAFRRDVKRESKGSSLAALNKEMPGILVMLANDTRLPAKYRDHALSGRWAHHRECHITPDLLLIYIKEADNILRLSRLGSHTELLKM
jgi:mRNA interferase YafQ